MNDSIIAQLDQVLSLAAEHRAMIKTIHRTQTKRRGAYIIGIPPDEKVRMIRKANELYQRKIEAVYQEINIQLADEGRKPLNNPYELKGENYNENRTESENC